MDSITSNVPAQIAAEARQRALAVLNSEPGCISYVTPADLETAALFIPVVSVIKPTQDDFYPPIPKVGIMAKPQLVNLLKEKAGINITRTETSKRGDYVYVAHVWGEKRQPDGSMLTEDAEYEFDCNIRAELDHPDDNEKARRRHVLEIAKFGNQRAVTGAQHSLIHKLAHVARSFRTPEELMRGMKVLRIDRNVNGIMADPSMREAVINHALGATETVFGPAKQIPRTVDVDSGEMIEQPKAEEGQIPLDTFEDDPLPAIDAEKTPLEKAREILETLREPIKVLPAGATKKLDALLAKKDAATMDEINGLIDRFTSALQARKEGGQS